MRIIIQPTDENMRRFGNQIASLSSAKAHRAMARAVNRVTNTVYGQVIGVIKSQSDIPTPIIKRQLKKRLAPTSIKHGGQLEGEVFATGAPLSLKHFRARQFSFGVKAKWGGQWHRLPGAFMGPRPGVIAPKLQGHVFTRTQTNTWVDGKRTPIEMQFGPSVPEELVRGESVRVFEQIVSEMLPDRIRHELGRVLLGK